ncbi:hypothetical protein F511_04369 [Dorcoceras hygrometricum]|uniref:Exocyst subunit Exo70 family protein n=1 Tax=Dorcoceras hygrometricum TaxID=472368 RepID=A0A2Z7BL63_9LAMI|nr:hypothetical protein F511_04369 [Dorcoceras hygrometricum]
MPRKGMRSLLFSPKSSSPAASPSTDQFSYPSRFGFSPSRPSFYESVMARTLDMVEPMIVKWDIEATAFGRVTSLFHDNRKEATDFIKCVKNLHRGMQYLITEDSKSDKLIRAQNLMQIAMRRLQKEFYQILSMNRAHLDPESVSIRSSCTSIESSVSGYGDDYEDDVDDEDRVVSGSLSEVEDVSTAVMADLRLISECMISSGYTKECLKIYKILRKSIVDEGIYKLGVEKFTAIPKMDWQALELRIKSWLNAVGAAVKILFNGEKLLCDQVFATSDSIRESCFAEITREGAMILFGFPENVVKGTKIAPEKVFRLLDMYAGISDHWPEIDSIFSSQSTASIKQQALTSLIRIGQFVRTSCSDLEAAISKSSSKSPPTGSGIHNLTTEVMDYLTILSDYSSILADIFPEYPPPSPVNLSVQEPNIGFSDSDEIPAAPLSRLLAWLISVLLNKLDAEAKNYKDASLAHLFLANNLQHVVVKSRTSNLKYLLGEAWVTKHESKIKQFVESYERLAWSHVIDTLPSEPTDVGTPEKVKETFKKFNVSFDQAYGKQSECVVPDSQLRDDIKVSIARKIFRRYREFYSTHSSTMRRNESMVSVVRYTPEDVGHHLSDLFFGNVGSGSFSSIVPSETRLTYNTNFNTSWLKILKYIYP